MRFFISVLVIIILSACGSLNGISETELSHPNNNGDSYNQENIESTWQGRLYTPTYLTKIDNNYFIVDCWHHRVIFSDKVSLPIEEWDELDDNLGGPHSIATDGDILVVDNTGFNKVNVYLRTENGKYTLTQESDGIGTRPHRIIYSPEKNGFYVLGSVSTDIYFFKNINGKLQLIFTKKLEFLKGAYTRSFHIIGDKMFFVSGASKISVVNYKDDSFNVITQYDVPEELSGMNDIIKIDDYYYITATPQKFIRTKDLNSLKEGLYEDLFDKYNLKGTPYYFEVIGEYIYLPEITEYSSILRFKIKNNEIIDFERLHDFGVPIKESQERKSELPT
ncbi:hypothetical protein P9E76_11895 [Schinkia azotoformans]|uniref:hypothetical protein n=1 Tax=Schinkia azotoformans TaxID=1454 RepID=UPI002DB9A8E6|nr:hypothetical protein [Schinkia azotoformans]MEC1639156.1 hypothetical protein [Schinkia azotoformans]MEC1945744.1 hypothetical protein [Schinkia azotoformans]